MERSIYGDRIGGVSGHVSIVTKCIKTGDILDVFENNNVFLDQGKAIMVKAFAEGGDNRIKTIHIGEDFGSGSIMVPEDVTSDMTEADQDEVYEVPTSSFTVSYPEADKVRFTASIDGPTLMNEYPSKPNVVYTSATLRTVGGEAVAYRRFPPRTISDMVSVDIVWTLTII